MGGIRELWTDNQDAALVEPGSIRELQGRLLLLASSEAERRRLGRAAADTAQRHTWHDAIRRVLVAYDDVVRAERRASTPHQEVH